MQIDWYACEKQALRRHDDLGVLNHILPLRVSTMIRDWQGGVMQLISDNVGSKRTRARVLSLGLNAVTVALIVVVFASTGGLTGGELVIAGGSAVIGQKLLETIFGEDAVRQLAVEARRDLNDRVRALFDGERSRVAVALEPMRFGATPDVLRREARALLEDVRRAQEAS